MSVVAGRCAEGEIMTGVADIGCRDAILGFSALDMGAYLVESHLYAILAFGMRDWAAANFS